MPLSRLEASEAIARLPKPGASRQWTVFKLAPAGVEAFEKLQQALASHLDASGKLEPKGSLSITIKAHHLLPRARSGKAAVPREIPIELDLKLNARDGYYTLYAGELSLGEKTP